MANPFCRGTRTLLNTNAPITANAPVMIPVAETLVPAKWFITATPAYRAATSTRTAAAASAAGFAAMTALRNACAAAAFSEANARMFVQLAAISSTPKAVPREITMGTTVWMLFATQLMADSSGSRARMAALEATVQTCAQVMGVFANSALVSAAAANMAFFTMAAVICPCAPISRSLPISTCR